MYTLDGNQARRLSNVARGYKQFLGGTKVFFLKFGNEDQKDFL